MSIQRRDQSFRRGLFLWFGMWTPESHVPLPDLAPACQAISRDHRLDLAPNDSDGTRRSAFCAQRVGPQRGRLVAARPETHRGGASGPRPSFPHSAFCPGDLHRCFARSEHFFERVLLMRRTWLVDADLNETTREIPPLLSRRRAHAEYLLF